MNWKTIKPSKSDKRVAVWSNKESGVIVEVADLTNLGYTGYYGFGFWDPRINKFRGLGGGFVHENKKLVKKRAQDWLKNNPYIERRW